MRFNLCFVFSRCCGLRKDKIMLNCPGFGALLLVNRADLRQNLNPNRSKLIPFVLGRGVQSVNEKKGTSKQFKDIKSIRRNGVAENCWETGGCVGLDYLGNGMEWPDQNHFMSNHIESVSQDPAWGCMGYQVPLIRSIRSYPVGMVTVQGMLSWSFLSHVGRSKWWVEELLYRIQTYPTPLLLEANHFLRSSIFHHPD